MLDILDANWFTSRSAVRATIGSGIVAAAFLSAEPDRVVWPSERDGAILLNAVVELVSSLAWPLVAVLALLTFRKQIRELIGRIRQASGFGSSFMFDAEARDTASEAAAFLSPDARAQPKASIDPAAASPSVKTEPEPAPEIVLEVPVADRWKAYVSHLHAWSGASHRSSADNSDDAVNILLGQFVAEWSQLEKEAVDTVDFLAEQGLTPIEPTLLARRRRTDPVLLAFEEMSALGFIPVESVDIYRRTKRLRNELIHSRDQAPSPEGIADSIVSVKTLMYSLSEGVGMLREFGEPSP